MEKPSEFPKKIPSEYFHTILQSIIQNRLALVLAIPGVLPLPLSNGVPAVVGVSILQMFAGLPCGINTKLIFDRTCQHIGQFGCLDSRYFMTVLRGKLSDPLSGYCSLQGMYLAAKKYGIEDQFFELKKQYSGNKIPNF